MAKVVVPDAFVVVCNSNGKNIQCNVYECTNVSIISNVVVCNLSRFQVSLYHQHTIISQREWTSLFHSQYREVIVAAIIVSVGRHCRDFRLDWSLLFSNVVWSLSVFSVCAGMSRVESEKSAKAVAAMIADIYYNRKAGFNRSTATGRSSRPPLESNLVGVGSSSRAYDRAQGHPSFNRAFRVRSKTRGRRVRGRENWQVSEQLHSSPVEYARSVPYGKRLNPFSRVVTKNSVVNEASVANKNVVVNAASVVPKIAVESAASVVASPRVGE